MIKLSIIHPVLNSHEIIRRQLLHYAKMELPDTVEILIIDDGSEPELTDSGIKVNNLRIIKTNDKRPWTWALARNRGAREAQGDILLMTDIDYIIPKEAILDALELKEDRMNFRREFAILDENGDMIQTVEAVLKYGLDPSRIPSRGFAVAAHTNSFVMKKKTFFDLGCYAEDRIGRPYPQGEDNNFQKKWVHAKNKGLVTRTEYRPLIYMFPNGRFCGDADFNPFGLFHNLSRKV